MTSRDEATTLRYALLTTRVSQALRHSSGDVLLSARERQALEKGAELLDQMIRGTAWSAGDNALGYCSADVPFARRALTTLEKLEKLTNESDVPDALRGMRTALQGLLATPLVKDSALPLTSRFFEVLSKEFSHEAADASFGRGFDDRELSLA